MGKVLFEKDGHLGRITINRSDQLNCFDYETLVLLGEIVESLQADKEVRAVIITGAGEKAFSAGADLKERRTLSEKEVRRNVRAIREVFTAIEELPQPTIAAINGYALGGGLELALACDFRYAVSGAVMGLTEVSWAIIPGAGGTQRLSRLVGTSRAKELILTARKIDAEKALDIGLVNEVYGQKDLIEGATSLAQEIMGNGPLAVTQAKYAINHGSNVDIHTGLAIEAKAYEVIIPTEDRIEALEAFKEKRPANFKGK
ncbi:putative enoyl-CoA hydratase/isomerase YngF [Thalassobacillus devorans]|uniref:Enoyl-CoA hydratase/isomerase YngF n=1 Tax=Thalassobacillus devorans TaxID=279813 RepID=A0ABQ1PLR6_9BACI|nr:enoyl-CoA hydratase-related protein [Thalassobacillus devorans]NIK30227.1 enoyl-CoA hydratase/carnithine racemase [Thalassobacillus devorans]GGC99420.1 putative enoyl-CoA hydratase/isomerase YngF [Thalassobacillus devorans]